MDVSLALRTIRAMVASLVAALPRLAAALLVIAAFVALGRVLRWLVLRSVQPGRGHESLRVALGRLAYTAAVAVGALVAATVAVPSFTVGGLIQLLGVSGVVVGFAFKEIFQNFLAGILILVARPFTIGDQIAVDSYEGTVEEILTRATVIRTFDRRMVVVPNADLFTKSVTVNTAYPERRIEYDLTLPAGADVDALKHRLTTLLRGGGIDGVAPDPQAEVLLIKLAGDGSATLRLRWWSPSERGEYLTVQDRVLSAVREALREVLHQAEEKATAAV
jgi:small-conductance mechanosensitive channel